MYNTIFEFYLNLKNMTQVSRILYNIYYKYILPYNIYLKKILI